MLLSTVREKLETNYFPSNDVSTPKAPLAVWRTTTDGMAEFTKESSRLKILAAKINTQRGINVTKRGTETKRWLIVYWSTFLEEGSICTRHSTNATVQYRVSGQVTNPEQKRQMPF